LNDLDIILAFNSITETIGIADNYVSTNEKKVYSNKDLIDLTKRRINHLTESYVTFRSLESEFRSYRRRNIDLERILLEKETELRELKKQNELLKQGL